MSRKAGIGRRIASFVGNRMFFRATSLHVAFIALVCAVPAHAQVHGRVTDAGGAPISGARVELWSPLERLASQETGPGGAFTFDEGVAARATGLIATRIGYGTRTQPVAAGGDVLVIMLSPVPIELQGIVVRGSARTCPNRDEVAARALWEAAAGRYGHPDTLFIGSSSRRMTNEVPRADVGVVDEPRLRKSARGTGPQRRAVRPAMGYGYRVSQSWREEFSLWHYVEFGSHFAQHFTDPTFGTYNSLSVRGQVPEGTVLVFCSRGLDRRAVGLEGTLTVAADTTFISATWRFRTRGPSEEAGGEVTFVPHPGRGEFPWLVPAHSLFWRKLQDSSDRFVQLWEEFDQWAVDPDFQDRPPPAINP